MRNEERYTEVDLGRFKSCGQPFTIAFAFPKEGPLVIKGMEDKVEEYIHNKLSVCHYKLTQWNNGKTNEVWQINNPEWTIVPSDESEQRRMYSFYWQGIYQFELKRIPKSFINDLEVIEDKISIMDILV